MDNQQLIDNLKTAIPAPILYGTLSYQGNEITFNDFLDNVLTKTNGIPNDINMLLTKLNPIISTVRPADQKFIDLLEIIKYNPQYSNIITLTDQTQSSYKDVLLDKYHKGLIDDNLLIVVGDTKKTIEEFYTTFERNRLVRFEDLQNIIKDAVNRSLSNENEYNKERILSHVINQETNETLNDYLMNDVALMIEGDEIVFGDLHTPIGRFVDEAINGVRMNMYNNNSDNVVGVDYIETPTEEESKDILIFPEVDTHLVDILNEYNRLITLFRTTSSQTELDEINKYHDLLIKEIQHHQQYMTNSIIQHLEMKYKSEYEEVSKRVVKTNFSFKELYGYVQQSLKEFIDKYKNSNDLNDISDTDCELFDFINKCVKIGIRNRETNHAFDELLNLAYFQISSIMLNKKERRDISMDETNVNIENKERKADHVIANLLEKLRKSVDPEELERKARVFAAVKGETVDTEKYMQEENVVVRAA